MECGFTLKRVRDIIRTYSHIDYHQVISVESPPHIKLLEMMKLISLKA